MRKSKRSMELASVRKHTITHFTQSHSSSNSVPPNKKNNAKKREKYPQLKLENPKGSLKKVEKKRETARDSKTLSYKYISSHFHLPLHEASILMKLEETKLKSRCRELGIKRWPYSRKKVFNCTSLLRESSFLEFKVTGTLPSEEQSNTNPRQDFVNSCCNISQGIPDDTPTLRHPNHLSRQQDDTRYVDNNGGIQTHTHTHTHIYIEETKRDSIREDLCFTTHFPERGDNTVTLSNKCTEEKCNPFRIHPTPYPHMVDNLVDIPHRKRRTNEKVQGISVGMASPIISRLEGTHGGRESKMNRIDASFLAHPQRPSLTEKRIRGDSNPCCVGCNTSYPDSRSNVLSLPNLLNYLQ